MFMSFETRGFPERDWKVFRELHKIALARYCDRILNEVNRAIANKGESSHDRYLRIYRIIHKRDEEMGRAFNDFRRSTALQQLLIIDSLGLLTEEDLARFTPETRQFVQQWPKSDRD
jgi:hypothetical protein